MLTKLAWLPQSARTQELPSLGDGIMCAAKGKTAQGNKIYLYTSVIDNNSLKKRQPVSITMVEPASEIVEGEVVVIDKKTQSVYVRYCPSTRKPANQLRKAVKIEPSFPPVLLFVGWVRCESVFDAQTITFDSRRNPSFRVL